MRTKIVIAKSNVLKFQSKYFYPFVGCSYNVIKLYNELQSMQYFKEPAWVTKKYAISLNLKFLIQHWQSFIIDGICYCTVLFFYDYIPLFCKKNVFESHFSVQYFVLEIYILCIVRKKKMPCFQFPSVKVQSQYQFIDHRYRTRVADPDPEFEKNRIRLRKQNGFGQCQPGSSTPCDYLSGLRILLDPHHFTVRTDYL